MLNLIQELEAQKRVINNFKSVRRDPVIFGQDWESKEAQERIDSWEGLTVNETIQKYSGVLKAYQMADVARRPYTLIKQRAAQLQITTKLNNKNHLYDALILEHYKTKTARQISELADCHPSLIYRRSIVLKVKPVIDRTHWGRAISITNKDGGAKVQKLKNLIMKQAGKKTPEELACITGYSANTIRARASEMGISVRLEAR